MPGYRNAKPVHHSAGLISGRVANFVCVCLPFVFHFVCICIHEFHPPCFPRSGFVALLLPAHLALAAARSVSMARRSNLCKWLLSLTACEQSRVDSRFFRIRSFVELLHNQEMYSLLNGLFGWKQVRKYSLRVNPSITWIIIYASAQARLCVCSWDICRCLPASHLPPSPTRISPSTANALMCGLKNSMRLPVDEFQ